MRDTKQLQKLLEKQTGVKGLSHRNQDNMSYISASQRSKSSYKNGSAILQSAPRSKRVDAKVLENEEI